MDLNVSSLMFSTKPIISPSVRIRRFDPLYTSTSCVFRVVIVEFEIVGRVAWNADVIIVPVIMSRFGRFENTEAFHTADGS